MKTLLLLLAAIPALAVTDSMTFTDAAGVPRTNEPMQFGRVFAQGEIPNYPQALINGTAVATQVNVENRWPDGSAKHVIVSFLIPSVAVNGTATFTFQDQPTCNCGPSARLTQSAMLASNFAFDAGVTVSGVTISARAMLSAWDGVTTTGVLDANAPNTTSPVSFWADGSIATTVILADHSATPAYDLAAGGSAPTIKSLRPIFICTFWPGINKVKVRFVLENVNTTTLQDLQYTAVLTTGTTPTQVYTTATTYPSGVLHQALTRWTKTYWIGGAPNDQYNLDHNLAYMASTFATPNWDTSKVVPASQITTDYNGWTSAQKDIYQPGLWQKSMGATGGRPDIGPTTGWLVNWLFTGDYRERQRALGQSELGAAWPVHFREGATGRFYDRAGAIPALGRTISVNARPTLDWPQGWAQPGVGAYDKINPVGSVSASTGWTWDPAHVPALNYIPYLLTGDYFFLEQLRFWPSFLETYVVHGTCGYCRGASTTAGAVYRGQLRAEGWGTRDLAETAWIEPDGTPEKALYSAWMDDVIAAADGLHNITTSAYCPTPTTCSNNAQWNWGRTTQFASISLPGSGALVNTSVVNGGVSATLVSGGSGYTNGSATGAALKGYTTNSGGYVVPGGSGGSITPTYSGGSVVSIAVVPGSGYKTAYYGIAGAGSALPSLYQWNFGDANLQVNVGQNGYGVDTSKCVSGISSFGYYYATYAWGRARELGFAWTPVLRDWVDRYYVGILTDPTFNPYLIQVGRACTTKMPSGGQFSSMADLLTSYYADPGTAIANGSYHPQLNFAGATVTSQLANWQGMSAFSLSDAQGGFEFLAAAAVAEIAPIGPGETQAWNWIGPKTNPSTLLNNTPTWAIIPRSLAYTSPPGISLQGITIQQ